MIIPSFLPLQQRILNPGTEVYMENAMFFYMEPAQDEFYLVWKDSEVDTAAQNLNNYGYEVTSMAEGGTLGMQGGVCVLFCRKY